jgi:hypothetical protein
MENSASVLSKIAEAKQMAERLAELRPSGAPWPMLFALLQTYEAMVRDHWPLTEEEKDGCKLGWFSVKNIEEVFPQLHGALSEVAYSLRHGGE